MYNEQPARWRPDEVTFAVDESMTDVSPDGVLTVTIVVEVPGYSLPVMGDLDEKANRQQKIVEQIPKECMVFTIESTNHQEQAILNLLNRLNHISSWMQNSFNSLQRWQVRIKSVAGI
jgi:hypothetical protein